MAATNAGVILGTAAYMSPEIGWQLVGYLGPQMSYRDEVDKHFGKPWRPKPASLELIARRPGKPWEDEKG